MNPRIYTPLLFVGIRPGVIENNNAILTLAKMYQPKAIAFDWPTAWQTLFEQHRDWMVPASITNHPCNDGHLIHQCQTLIAALQETHELLCLDDSVETSRTPDMALRRNIYACERYERTLVVIDYAQASKKLFPLQNRPAPIASFFRHKATSVGVHYAGGSYYKQGERQPFLPTQASCPSNTLIPCNGDTGYDYAFQIPFGTAGTIPTAASQLF
ncbi:MAG: hypothetical protein LR017_00960 [Candidatus Pacebacteria bacterium]|nr:hypothetical protein [Candidatus Paceibacterota bacterium]